jgi:hypothetical protein
VIDLMLRTTPNVADGLGTEEAMAALVHYAQADRARDVPNDDLGALSRQMALLPQWGPLASRSASHVAHGLAAMRGIEPAPSDADELTFDPVKFMRALSMFLATEVDAVVDIPGDLATWVAGVARQVRRRVDPASVPIDFREALRLRAEAGVGPVGIAPIWPPAPTLEGDIVGPDATAWLDDVDVLISQPPTIAQVVRSVVANLRSVTAEASVGSPAIGGKAGDPGPGDVGPA